MALASSDLPQAATDPPKVLIALDHLSELLNRVMVGHRRPRRAQEHVRPKVAFVKEPDQLFVVTTRTIEDVVENETLELFFTVSPVRRSRPQKLFQVIQVGFGHGIADLVPTLEMTGQTEQRPQLVLNEPVGGGDTSKRSHHVEVTSICFGLSRLGYIDGRKIDTKLAG